MISARMQAAPFTIRILCGSAPVESWTATLTEFGLSGPSPPQLILVRMPGTQGDYTELFGELLSAFYRRDLGEVRRLVDLGAGLDSNGQLLRASWSEQAGRANQPAAAKGTLHVANAGEAGSTLLHLAVREQLAELALYCVASGADVAAPNEAGRQPLAVCALKGLAGVARALLAARADPEATDGPRRNALTYARDKGHDEVASVLVVAMPKPLPSSSVLEFCRRGMPLTAMSLLEADAHPGDPDDIGCNALCYAEHHGMDDVAQALRARGQKKLGRVSWDSHEQRASACATM